MAAELDLRAAQIDAAERGGWNIGFFCSGAVLWLYVTAVGFALPLEQARYWWFGGTFAIFPMAVVFSWAFGVDPFTRGNPLGQLVGNVHMSAIALTLPIVVAALFHFPEALLLAMAIAYCIDFFAMSWAFGTRLFAAHAVVRVALASLIWFFWPEERATALPASVAACYLATIVAILYLRPRWLARMRTA